MWDSAIQLSTQLVTDALLHRTVLPMDALAFEKISGAISVRTALRLQVSEQTLLFVVPEATASTARYVAAALLIGDHAHKNSPEQLPPEEVRRLLKGDMLIVTQAISDSKSKLDELRVGRGQRLSDIWDITPLSKYSAPKASKPRVFLANPGWVAKSAAGRRFGAVIIDASHPRTFDQLPALLRTACGCSSLRICITPPPSESVLAACGYPAKTSVWLWDSQAKQDAQIAVESDDPVIHSIGDRFLWICDSDNDATAALAKLYKCLTTAAKAADGRSFPGLRQCWGIYNRLRQLAVPLAQLEQVAAATWSGNLRIRIDELDSIQGHGSVAWDTTWPELLAATKSAYQTLLKRGETAKFWAVASKVQAFLSSPTEHLRIVVGSEAELTLLVPALGMLVDGFAEAVSAGRVELVTASKEARLVAEGHVCPTVLLAPRTNGHRYLDAFSSVRVDELLYPHEVATERSTQKRLHAPWAPLQADERRVELLEPLGFRPIKSAKLRPAGPRPPIKVQRMDGHPVTLVSDSELSHEIDIDGLAAATEHKPFDGLESVTYPRGGADGVTEVRYVTDDTQIFYGNQKVDVFFSETSSVQRHLASELRPGWKVITFVDGRYDGLFQRLTEAVNSRLSQQQRVTLELWRATKQGLVQSYSNKRELYDKLSAKGLTSSYGTFISWLIDGEEGVIAPQQFDDFKILASEIESYARSKVMLEATFKAVQHERGRNRKAGRTLRKFLRSVISGEGYEEALASARELDTAMADVFAAVEVLEVASVKVTQRTFDG